MPHIEIVRHNGLKVYFRPGTTDTNALKEVIEQKVYRKTKLDFDVQKGEHWLDLGANIGAFGIYCALRGATATCFEPDPENFQILTKNLGHLPGFRLYQMAVTDKEDIELPFWKGIKSTDHYRATIHQTRAKHPNDKLPNLHASFVRWPYGFRPVAWPLDEPWNSLTQQGRNPRPMPGTSIHPSSDFGVLINKKAGKTNHPRRDITKGTPADYWDGVKMDIEGAEFGIVESNLIPYTKKLVMEYHLSRRPEMAPFREFVALLRERFSVVDYIPSMDQPYPNDTYPGKFDRQIFCMDPR